MSYHVAYEHHCTHINQLMARSRVMLYSTLCWSDLKWWAMENGLNTDMEVSATSPELSPPNLG